MPDDTVTPAPKPRRYVFLDLALAVAKGLPEPSVRFSDHDYDGSTPYLYMNLDRHEDARTWAAHFGQQTRSYERPDLGRCYVEADAQLHGWNVHIIGNEPLPAADEVAKAAELVDAIGGAK